MIPSLDPADAGVTGLLWLLFSYGYALYYASCLISEGSDLLLLLPSISGIVGSIILPLLGAVPDAAIMLFSGLGSKAEAQETLSVGVGALAGSTIMLLTVPWALSVYGGRVDMVPQKRKKKDEMSSLTTSSETALVPDYKGSPRLSHDLAAEPLSWPSLTRTGVAIPKEVRQGSILMVATTLPYFLIQIPAMFVAGRSDDEVASYEKNWAVCGFVICIVGFVFYLYLQVQYSNAEMDKLKQVTKMKQLLNEGMYSLQGCLSDILSATELSLTQEAAGVEGATSSNTKNGQSGSYGATENSIPKLPERLEVILRELLSEPFKKYDRDNNKALDPTEVSILLHDLHEPITEKYLEEMFKNYDHNGDGTIDFDEFIHLCYSYLLVGKFDDKIETASSFSSHQPDRREMLDRMTSLVFDRDDLNDDSDHESDDSNEEEEELVPEDIADLSPEEQRAVIVKRALYMLTGGTFMVVLFSDPMVDVLQEVAVRLDLSPFYVSFILAPLASNASEVIASMYYAAKKTRKTIAVSLTTLEGAASMNNTFCLSIFMGLIYFRGLAWHYTAETVAIVLVQMIMCVAARRDKMTLLEGLGVMTLFPLSLLLVAVMEAMGFD